MYWKQWIIDLRGCMVRRAKAISSRHLVWINSATHSFMLRRVSFSVSALTRCMEAFTTSSSLIAARRSSCSCSAFFFSACRASHSALRLASAASCSARRFSSSASVVASALAGTSCSLPASSPSVFAASEASSPFISANSSAPSSASNAGDGGVSTAVEPAERLADGTGSSSKISSSSKASPAATCSAGSPRSSCLFSAISEKYPIVISFPSFHKKARNRPMPIPCLCHIVLQHINQCTVTVKAVTHHIRILL